MSNSISLIAILSLFTLLPFIIASGTCFIKFSIVFVIVRNALGLQQVPSNMTLNGIALLLSMFVMMPVGKEIYNNSQNENLSFNNVASVVNFVETGMSGYKSYLIKYSEPELVSFFEKIQKVNSSEDNEEIIDDENISIFSLLPAYALSEIKSAFIIGFYIYLPFVVVDSGYIQRSVNVRYDDDESGNHIYTDKINSVCRDGRLDNVIERTHFTIF
ncbi:type III secretion system protein [Escherichia coli]|uniref:Type III secretion system protein n=2 Tax=root TaxID=1 RepID=A0A376VDP3_ECOLX|nr:type III secretion system protein [Escherichia coli]